MNVVTTSLNPASSSTHRPLQSVKLLSQREDYATCHISVQGDPHRLPAIALDGRFYSFFRVVKDAQKALDLLVKLSSRGDQTALTPARQGYAVWVYEAHGAIAHPAKQSQNRPLPVTFGPADTWILPENHPDYRVCMLKVPDLPDAVPGLAHGQKFYSLYRRETDDAAVLKLAARLSQRGDEVVILRSNSTATVYIYEPGATLQG